MLSGPKPDLSLSKLSSPSQSMEMYLSLCKAICSVGCSQLSVTEEQLLSQSQGGISAPSSHKGQPFRDYTSRDLFWHIFPWGFKDTEVSLREGGRAGNTNSGNFCRNSSWPYKNPRFLVIVF